MNNDIKEAQLQKKVQEFTNEICRDLDNMPNTCQMTMVCTCALLSKLLPLAAMSGGLKASRDEPVDRKIALMGNQAVSQVIEVLNESGIMMEMKEIERLNKFMGGLK